MWQNVGIIRNQTGLENALKRIDQIKSDSARVKVSSVENLIALLEFNNMLLLAKVVAKASLLRTETRGAHYREDYPGEDLGLGKSSFAWKEHGSLIRIKHNLMVNS